MSKLDELLKQYCPNGVEYKPLWGLTIWDKKFNAVERRKQSKTYDYRYFLANDLKPLIREDGDVKVLTTNTSHLFTVEDLVEGYVVDREIVAIPWGGNPNVQYYNGRFVTADNRIAAALDPNELSMRYLYYYLQSNLDLIGSFYRGSGIKHPDMAKVLDLQIPVPPLPVQQEIVRILDKFTELEAELEAELQRRKTQYEYYRDRLLTFRKDDEDDVLPWLARLLDKYAPNGVEWKPIGEIAEVRSGWGFPNKEQGLRVGDLPFYKVGDMNNPQNAFYMTIAENYVSLETAKRLGCKPAPAGTIVFPKIGAAIGTNKKRMLAEESCYDNNVMGVIIGKDVLPRYLYFVFEQQTLMRFSNGEGVVPSIRKSSIEDYVIPVPPLPVQEAIVSVLYKFSTLCTDISAGLPAEIAARRKQYEYYRDKLLSFNPIV